MADIAQTAAEFERTRSQLMGVSAQKNQLQAQSEVLEKTIEELSKTKEEKVYKAVGNIVLLTDTKLALKEVKEQKESVDLRFKTVDKQESTIIDKLNKLRMEIEKQQGKQVLPADSKAETPDIS